jgi:hypothetical protein
MNTTEIQKLANENIRTILSGIILISIIFLSFLSFDSFDRASIQKARLDAVKQCINQNHNVLECILIK